MIFFSGFHQLLNYQKWTRCTHAHKVLKNLLSLNQGFIENTKSHYPQFFLDVFVCKYLNQPNMLPTMPDVCFRNVVKVRGEALRAF